MGRIRHVIDMYLEHGEPATAFVEAARWGELEVLKCFIKEGMNVNARGRGGTTALINAASAGQTSIVRFLIRQGADVNAVDDVDHRPAISWRLYGYHNRRGERSTLAVIKALLSAGADPRIRDADGKTAYDIACLNCSEAIQALLPPAK